MSGSTLLVDFRFYTTTNSIEGLCTKYNEGNNFPYQHASEALHSMTKHYDEPHKLALEESLDAVNMMLYKYDLYEPASFLRFFQLTDLIMGPARIAMTAFDEGISQGTAKSSDMTYPEIMTWNFPDFLDMRIFTSGKKVHAVVQVGDGYGVLFNGFTYIPLNRNNPQGDLEIFFKSARLGGRLNFKKDADVGDLDMGTVEITQFDVKYTAYMKLDRRYYETLLKSYEIFHDRALAIAKTEPENFWKIYFPQSKKYLPDMLDSLITIRRAMGTYIKLPAVAADQIKDETGSGNVDNTPLVIGGLIASSIILFGVSDTMRKMK